MQPTSNRDQIIQYAKTITKDSESGCSGLANKARSSVSQLTSEERNYLLQVLTSTPPPNDRIEKSILNKFSKIDKGEPVDKDGDKNLVQQATSNISRVIQNTLGIRKSTDRVLTELKHIKLMESIKDPTNDFKFYFMDPNSYTALRDERLISYGNRELDCKNEYRLFGLKPDASPEAVDRAFVEYLNKHDGNIKKKEIAEDSYRRIVLLREAKEILSADLAPPLTLSKAYEVSKNSTKNTPEKYERAMRSLTILAADNSYFPGTWESFKKTLHDINRYDRNYWG